MLLRHHHSRAKRDVRVGQRLLIGPKIAYADRLAVIDAYLSGLFKSK